jgi:ABC-type methionine transport system ATPase subunit
MNRDLGTTIVLATNSTSQVQKFASVLIYLDNGHIAKIRSGAGKSMRTSRWNNRFP